MQTRDATEADYEQEQPSLVPPSRKAEISARVIQKRWETIAIVFATYHAAAANSADTSHLRAAPLKPVKVPVERHAQTQHQ